MHLERVNAMLGEVKLMYRGLSTASKQLSKCCEGPESNKNQQNFVQVHGPNLSLTQILERSTT